MNTTILYVLAIYFLVLVTPGPNFAMVFNLSSQGRKTASYMMGLGFAFGAVTLAVLSVVGLLSLLTHAPAVKIALGLVASVILIWRGLASFAEAAAEGPGAEVAAQEVEEASSGRFRAFLYGFLFNFTNPKALAYFIGVFGGEMSTLPVATLAWVLLFCLALEITWYTSVTFVLSTGPSRRILARGRVFLNRLTGSVLIFLGLGNVAYLVRST